MEPNELPPIQPEQDNNMPVEEKGWASLWQRILLAGLGERFLTIGSTLVTLLLLVLIIWVVGSFFLVRPREIQKATEAEKPDNNYTMEAVLPYYNPSYPSNDVSSINRGIFRYMQIHTDLPAKPRGEIIKYTVSENDTLIGIGEKFSLSPSTILWGNPYTLRDDAHNLKAGMEIDILPVDGVYYEWHDGDGLNGVSQVLGVTPEDIINYPLNHLSAATIGDYSNPNIKTGTWLVIPGGSREFTQWSAPLITRENPAVASIYGPGACEGVLDGPLGNGTFIWPSSEHYISGYDFNEETNHRAIDIGGTFGNPIYAADAGVIVYAGWNNNGYGNVVMIDHGNNWQTLYAHLESYNVQCGYYVFQGDVIGGMGSTGNSSGPHLHYEMRYNGMPQNPNNFY